MFNNNKERVVKCGECGRYFGFTEKDKECRLCHAKFDEKDEEGTKEKQGLIKIKIRRDS